MSNPCDDHTRVIPRNTELAKIYCAGPMFSPAEKAEQCELGLILESEGFEIFLPQRDGIELKAVMDQVDADPSLAPMVILYNPVLRHAVFALDIYMVVGWADAIVFNMNGRVPDEGGVVEATAAFLSGKAVVLYKETPVSFIAGEDNPMVDGLGYKFWNVDDKKDVAEELRRSLGRVAEERSVWTGPSLPPQVLDHLELGRKIWNVRLALDPRLAPGRGWTADVARMIREFPKLIQENTPITVENDGTVRVDQLVIGLLPLDASPDLRRDVIDLWKVFGDGVRDEIRRRQG